MIKKQEKQQEETSTSQKRTFCFIAAAAVLVIVVILVVAAISRFSDRIADAKKERTVLAEARVAEIPYISLHTFPDGIKQITIPIGPERWEGITVPLGTTAYRIDPTIWHQLKPWNGKPGPIVKKEEAVHRIIPIQINEDVESATFWVRGEKEATITLK